MFFHLWITSKHYDKMSCMNWIIVHSYLCLSQTGEGEMVTYVHQWPPADHRKQNPKKTWLPQETRICYCVILRTEEMKSTSSLSVEDMSTVKKKFLPLKGTFYLEKRWVSPLLIRWCHAVVKLFPVLEIKWIPCFLMTNYWLVSFNQLNLTGNWTE